MNCDNHCVNFGDHDDYSFLHKKHSCGNYQSGSDGIMTVRGADSIDEQYRVENVSWWENEELSYQEMQNAIEHYEKRKPQFMITHDCPQSIREQVFGIYDKTITSNGLQTMLEIYKPKLWIFGHHHKSINITIDDTRFICLKELNVFNLEI